MPLTSPDDPHSRTAIPETGRGFASWKAPLRRTALVWWGGSFSALVVSPLAECSHCVRTYLALLPVQPGVLLAHLTGVSGLAFVAAALSITLVLLAVTATLLREFAPKWLFFAVPVAVLAAAQGVALGHALRM